MVKNSMGVGQKLSGDTTSFNKEQEKELGVKQGHAEKLDKPVQSQGLSHNESELFLKRNRSK